MASASTIRLLNRLLVIHSRSLAMYLGYAQPSWNRGDEPARQALEQIVADQRSLVDRIGEAIVDRNGAATGGSFPIEFTGYHDLSFDFLLGKLIEDQRRDIGLMKQITEGLASEPMAKALAEECLGAGKAHLEMLQALNHSPQLVAGGR
jgi:hypothetical protein